MAIWTPWVISEAGYVEYIPETGQTLAAAQSLGPSCAAWRKTGNPPGQATRS